MSNLHEFCTEGISSKREQYSGLLKKNHKEPIWPKTRFTPVETRTRGFNLILEISKEENWDGVWRAIQMIGMVGSLGIYSPARTFTLKVKYSLLEIPEAIEDLDKIAWADHVIFTGVYSKRIFTYHKIWLGRLFPYYPDDRNCDAVTSMLNQAISEIADAFSDDVKAVFH